MLELKTYTKTELAQLLGTTDNQGIKRKLDNYGVTYTVNGRGQNAQFTITDTGNVFKAFCITELGFPAQTDFRKLMYFLYYFLQADDFMKLPMEMMEQYMRDREHPVSRQTIQGYLRRIERKEWISLWAGEYTYYFAYKETRKPTTHEEYAKAWSLYWELKAQGYDYPMPFVISRYGGAPRKQRVIVRNGIYEDRLQQLTDLVCAEMDKEIQAVDIP